jgi:hypothetical protein
LFGFDLSHKRTVLADEVRADIDQVKRIKSLQRTVNTPSNILCIKGPKNFKNIEKSAFSAFAKLEDPRKKVLKKEDPKKIAGKKDGSKSSHMPIIIVPAAAQSLLNLYNVKEFLIDSQFVSSDDMRKKIDKKPLQVVLTRDPKKLSGTSLPKFLVLDTVDTLKDRDWDRVVAVFATGQDWQFKGWKWERPVDIFSNGIDHLRSYGRFIKIPR